MQTLQTDALATAVVARFEQTGSELHRGVTRLRWSNAGHPPPLVLHADGRIEDLAGERTDLMLGVDPGTLRSEWMVTVGRGATVLLYTDGLVEGRDLPLDEGIARLREVLADLADLPLPELADALLQRLRPGGLQDDVALVALRLHPQDRPRPAMAGPAHVPPGVPLG
jgi:serine phosphatase RsbU (regulator of sigma subunit)